MVTYITAVIILFLIVCGLGAQLEIEAKDKDRRRARMATRQTAWDEVENVMFITRTLGWFQD